jgi:hypothetical protein
MAAAMTVGQIDNRHHIEEVAAMVQVSIILFMIFQGSLQTG